MIGVLIKIAPRLIIVEIQLDRDCIVPYLIDVVFVSSNWIHIYKHIIDNCVLEMIL